MRRVAAAGGAITTLTTPDGEKGDRGDTNPSFLSDGQRYLVFHRQSANAERSGLWITSIDRPAAALRLVEATAGGFAEDVAGLGPTVVFARNGRLFAQTIDLGRQVLTGDARDLMAIGDGGFSLSRNSLLAHGAVVTQQPGRLVWFDRSGAVLSQVGSEAVYRVD